jgi:ubiquinone/menaquinone biosynthesis C-methylase UbiE
VVIFEKYWGAYARKRVLDLGVGGGRTTHSLAPHASLYIGIDYSRAMIEICQDRFPHHQFEPGDARDLSRFPAGWFDFVLFSYNGIDFVDHADRLQVLKEIARVSHLGGSSSSVVIA